MANIKTRFTHRVIIMYGIVMLTAVTLAIFLLPSLFARSFAESQFASMDKAKTITTSSSFLDSLLSPSYVIFTVENDNEARANSIKLKRQNIIFWQIDSVSYYRVVATDNINAESQGQKAQNNLSMLYEAVKNNSVSPTNFSETLPSGPQIKPTTSEVNLLLPGAVWQELSDSRGKYKIEVVTGASPSAKLVKINGKLVPILQNSSSLSFDISEKYIYYSKFRHNG